MTLIFRTLLPLFLLVIVSILYVEAKWRRPLNNFVRHFEPVNYDRKDVHRRMKRAIDLSPHADVHIKFNAFGKNLTMHMRRNHEIFAPNFKIVDEDEKPIAYDYTRFFHGSLEGHPGSYCMGLLDEGRFQGKISMKDDEWHIEPAEKYFPDDQEFHSVVYSHHDLDYEFNFGHARVPDRPTTFKGSSYEQKKMQAQAKAEEERTEKAKYDKASNEQASHSRSKRGSKNRHHNTCYLKVVADHLFMRKFVRRETAIDQMVLHYKAVEYIFRNQTFNSTDPKYGAYFNPEGIGFRIQEVHVWKDVKKVPPTLRPEYISVYRLLELFSEMNHSSVCEAFLFTDRSFDNGVMGLAWIAYPYGQAGGICDPYAKYGGKFKSYNTGLLSFKLFNREAPPPVTEITFAHELGHAFGAQHDPPTALCQPEDSKGGKYIMYDKATSGFQKNNRFFSDCSLANMIPVINAKGLEVDTGCFGQRFWAICGNGAHEEGEICDCGTVSTCVEQCCVPVGSKEGTPCTFANLAYECSPSRGPCCINSTCTLRREFEKCYDGTECREPGFCDGLHYVCPEIKFRPNNTLCDKDRSVCLNGFCQGSLCLRYGLEGCLCESQNEKCHVCCQYEGECRSAFNIPIMPNQTLSRGRPCDYYRGYCDSQGTCVGIDMDGPLRLLYFTFFTEEGIKMWFKKYWYVVILGSLLILMLLAVFVYYCQAFTPTNNPLREKKRATKKLRKRRKHIGGYSAGGYPAGPIGGGQPIPMAATYT